MRSSYKNSETNTGDLFQIDHFNSDHTHGGDINGCARRFGIPAREIVDFSASINPLGVSGRVSSAINSGLTSIIHYPEQYSHHLISEAARYYGIDESCLLAGNGSTEFIYLLPLVFKPQNALIIAPAFSEYRNALLRGGCRIDMLTLREEEEFNLRNEDIFDYIKAGYDLIYIGNPANPTGTMISRKRLISFIDRAADKGTTCIVDEAFIDFAGKDSLTADATRMPNLIVLRSMTKFFAIPGLRVGFVISNPEIMDRIKSYKEPWSVNTLGSIAAIESMEDKAYIHRTSEFIKKEKSFLFSRLNNIPWLKPFKSAANYILIKILRDNMDAELLYEMLGRKGIIIRTCTNFEGLGDNFFRVAVRNRIDNERLIKSLIETNGNG